MRMREPEHECGRRGRENERGKACGVSAHVRSVPENTGECEGTRENERPRGLEVSTQRGKPKRAGSKAVLEKSN